MAKRIIDLIRFHEQNTSGLHTAHNLSKDLSKGKYLVKLDSDDQLFPHALNRFDELWHTVENQVAVPIYHVSCLGQTSDGAIYDGWYPSSPMICDYFEMNCQHRPTHKGDGFDCFLTSVWQQYRFPNISDTRHIPESIVLSQIAQDGWRAHYVNEVLGVIGTEAGEGLGPRLTDSDTLDSAPGYRACHRHRLNNHLRWLWRAPGVFLRSAGGYTKHSLACGLGPRSQLAGLDAPLAVLLWLSMLPIGTASWLLHRRR
jgi:glycosyltransferase involved in cell wall biosynthesis